MPNSKMSTGSSYVRPGGQIPSSAKKDIPLSSGSRLLSIVAISVYSALFLVIYLDWASPLYGEYGLVSFETSSVPLILAIGVIFAFSLGLPLQISKYSRFVMWFIFLVILIPSVLVVSVQGYGSFSSMQVIACVSVSFLIVVCVSEGGGKKIFKTRKIKSAGNVTAIIGSVYILLNTIMLVVFWETISFASLDDGIEQRQLAATLATGGLSSLGFYALNWLGFALNPYLLALGMTVRRYSWLIVPASIGQILVYSTLAGKIVLVSTVAAFLFGILSARQKELRIVWFQFGFAIIMLICLILAESDLVKTSPLAFVIISLLYMRTFAIQGAMLGTYSDFFSFSELTYWSHVTGLNLFVQYPYDSTVAYVIGRHLIGGTGFGANASFWASDGIAALGNVGIIIIGLVVGVVFRVANSIVPPSEVRFAAIATLPFLMNFANIPLFTSLITGGGLLLAALLAFGPRTNVSDKS